MAYLALSQFSSKKMSRSSYSSALRCCVLVALFVASASSFVVSPPTATPRSTTRKLRVELGHLRGDEKEAQPELQTPSELAESIVANVFEGSWGSRGELWVVGQAVIIGSVIAAPDIPAFSVATRLAGVLVMLFGLAIAVVGAAELGPSLSPWPRPIAANELQTDGIYSLCRHPMYAGFLCGAAGLGLLTASAERLRCAW